jgi:hypothetical protein
MESNKIDLQRLRTVVNEIVDHLVQDLGIDSVAIEDKEDFYWNLSSPEIYDTSRKPEEFEAGRLTDDLEFVQLIHRGESADISYNLVHVAPLLKYVGEKVKR